MSDHVPKWMQLREFRRAQWSPLRREIQELATEWYPFHNGLPANRVQTILRDLIENSINMQKQQHQFRVLNLDSIIINADSEAFLKYIQLDQSSAEAKQTYNEALDRLIETIFPADLSYPLEFEHFRHLASRASNQTELEQLFYHPVLLSRVERILFVHHAFVMIGQKCMTEDKTIWKRLEEEQKFMNIENTISGKPVLEAVYKGFKRDYKTDARAAFKFYRHCILHYNDYLEESQKISLETLEEILSSTFQEMMITLFNFLVEENIDLSFKLPETGSAAVKGQLQQQGAKHQAGSQTAAQYQASSKAAAKHQKPARK